MTRLMLCPCYDWAEKQDPDTLPECSNDCNLCGRLERYRSERASDRADAEMDRRRDRDG